MFCKINNWQKLHYIRNNKLNALHKTFILKKKLMYFASKHNQILPFLFYYPLEFIKLFLRVTLTMN